MASTRRNRRFRQSTLRPNRARSSNTVPADSKSNNDRALIIGPIMPKPSNYKPILQPRPTMLQFAPYQAKRSSRSFFILTIYMITLIILMLAFMQWEAVVLYEPLRDFFKNEYWLSVSCVLIALTALSMFMLIREARYMPIFNWVLLIFIIELMVIGLCAIASCWQPISLIVYFLLSIFLIVVCLLIGSYIPCDLTANVAGIFLFSILLFIFSQLMIVLHVINTVWNGYYVAFTLFNIIIVLMFVMYHAQLIKGGRYAEISATDGLFAVIVLFFYFCLIFMLFAYVWPQFDEMQMDNNYNDTDDDNNSTTTIEEETGTKTTKRHVITTTTENESSVL